MDNYLNLTPRSQESLFHSTHSENMLEIPRSASYARRKFLIVHPKVFKAINAIRPLSPQRIISDTEQPLSGSLYEIRQRNLQKREEFQIIEDCMSKSSEFKQKLEISKKGVSLNLKKNSLIMRRTVERTN